MMLPLHLVCHYTETRALILQLNMKEISANRYPRWHYSALENLWNGRPLWYANILKKNQKTSVHKTQTIATIWYLKGTGACWWVCTGLSFLPAAHFSLPGNKRRFSVSNWITDRDSLLHAAHILCVKKEKKLAATVWLSVFSPPENIDIYAYCSL